MKTLLSLLCALLLSACASSPQLQLPAAERVLKDSAFKPLTSPVDTSQVFALSEAMKRYLRSPEMTWQLSRSGRQQGLLDALYDTQKLKLEYDAEMTRNAAEAFDARAGNCLSLVIMTAAFAKELGLDVQFQQVSTEEVWGRSGDLHLQLSHVNLVLGRGFVDARSVGREAHRDADRLIVDFQPGVNLRTQHARPIGEDTILAMYLNNRAAEFLAQGQINTAYWWVREAIQRVPKFLTAYNTLGVIYRRHGELGLAEQLYREVLAMEPDNTQVLTNLSLTLRDQGRQAEAQVIHQRLAQLQPNPPFAYFNRGLVALREGRFHEAKALFHKELDRAAYHAEFHYWLALTHYALDELHLARKQMTLALENTTTRRDRALYSAKLNQLREVH